MVAVATTGIAVAGLVAYLAMLGVRHTMWLSQRMVEDRDRYLAAVVPLGADPRFHRMAGVAVATELRRRGFSAVAPLARRATVAVMELPGFAPSWSATHRVVHVITGGRPQRHRSALPALAVMGTALQRTDTVAESLTDRLTRWPLRMRPSSGPPARRRPALRAAPLSNPRRTPPTRRPTPP